MSVSRFWQFRAVSATLAFIATGLGGCNLEWEKPESSVPPPDRFREAQPKTAPPIATGRDFASKFGSKELTDVVEQALEQNRDIAIAVARIDQADANALIAARETAASVKRETEAVAAAKIALDAAEARLLEGTIDEVTLATIQTTFFQYELNLTIARLAYFQSAVSLCQALGGGWSPTTREAEIARADLVYESEKGLHP